MVHKILSLIQQWIAGLHLYASQLSDICIRTLSLKIMPAVSVSCHAEKLYHIHRNSILSA